MPGMNAPMGILTVPIWVAGAASAVFLVVIVLAIGKAGAAALMASLFRVAIVALGVYAGWVYLQRAALQDQAAERRSLDERSEALMARAIAPGLALSCLDGLAGEAVEVACEKAVFASPEAVAAAVSYVTAQLGLLAEGTEHAERNDTAYRAELVALRTTIELDRFGIVAHVFSRRDGCTVERTCSSSDRVSLTQQPSSRVGRQFDDRGVIVLWLVDPRRNRPHSHRVGRERPHQIARVSWESYATWPAAVVYPGISPGAKLSPWTL